LRGGAPLAEFADLEPATFLWRLHAFDHTEPFDRDTAFAQQRQRQGREQERRRCRLVQAFDTFSRALVMDMGKRKEGIQRPAQRGNSQPLARAVLLNADHRAVRERIGAEPGADVEMRWQRVTSLLPGGPA